MHINMVRGDFKFAMWEKDAQKDYRRKIHELRVNGYRKINEECDYLNYYEYYRKKGKKKIITVTIMLIE